mgnify:CR=1 FL=1
MAPSLVPSDIQSVKVNITKLWSASGVSADIDSDNPNYLNSIDGSLQTVDVV